MVDRRSEYYPQAYDDAEAMNHAPNIGLSSPNGARQAACPCGWSSPWFRSVDADRYAAAACERHMDDVAQGLA